MVAAVLEELRHLLNSRCHLRGDLLYGVAGTVLEYGVPDLSRFSPADETDHRRVAELLEQKIAAYEPRLRNVRVVLAPSTQNPMALTGRVIASLRAGSVDEPVSFPLAIDREAATVGFMQASASQ